VFFALAYEQTGRLRVPIIAHALFNLHTILLVMAGVT
jgi:membrane protease YdiL (CAAX protease family)